MGTPPPAGWFTSPDGAGMQRWWDGAAWTSFTRPVEVPTPRPEPPVAAHGSTAHVPQNLEETADALAALQKQGGLIGAFAAMASEVVATQLPPAAPTTPRAPGEVQAYGRPAYQNPFDQQPTQQPTSGGVSWHVGTRAGGSNPDGFVSEESGGFRRRRRPIRPVGRLFFGLILLVLGSLTAYLTTNENRTHADESTVSGSVVEHSTRVENGDSMCSPVASYTVGGTTYRASSSTWTRHCPAIGSAVTVIYTTAEPGDGHTKDSSPLLYLLWLLPVLGLGIAVSAVRSLGIVARSLRTLFPSRRGPAEGELDV
jgi:Protein of unknown function (DUF2510)/Protein of unknown function (DUF3592)